MLDMLSSLEVQVLRPTWWRRVEMVYRSGFGHLLATGKDVVDNLQYM